MITEFYKCPECGESLICSRVEKQVQCLRCQQFFTIKNKVLLFSLEEAAKYLSGNSGYDSEMESILNCADQVGWLNALEEYDKKNEYISRLSEYATNLSRVDFKFLIPFNKQSIVLDIGGGHGLIALTLAKSVKQVYTTEKITEQAEFMALRAQQESLTNVFVSTGGGDTGLPFKDQSFDLVILNGVFEWIGFETDFKNVGRRQVEMLREIRRVLKTNGQAWVTTKNKYSLSMIVSKNIHNNNLRFITLFPDILINSLSQRLGHAQYLSGLKSVKGYRELFAREGFAVDRTWVPVASFRYPTEYIDFEKGYPLVSYSRVRHLGMLNRIIVGCLPWVVKKTMAHSYAFVLRKDGHSSEDKGTILEKVKASVREISGGYISSLICPSSSSLSSSVIAVVRKGQKTFLLKINRYEGLPFLESENRNLQYIREHCSSYVDLLPEVICTGHQDGFAYSMQTYYRGYGTLSNVVVCAFVRMVCRRGILERMSDFLIDLARFTKKKNSLSFVHYVQEPIERLLAEKHDERLLAGASKCLRVLSERWSDIPLIFEHGDMQVGNIIIMKKLPLTIKVLDWESGTADGYPCVDYYALLKSNRLDKRRMLAMLSNYCRQIDVDMAVVKHLLFLRLVTIRENLRNINGLEKTHEWRLREASFDKKIKAVINDFS